MGTLGPVSDRPPVSELIAGLAVRLGVPRFVAVCTDLMAGADREEYVEELRSLTGHDWHPGDGVFDRETWQDYWVRTWGASATDAVVRGLADEHWRPAEMCLKIAARHEVAGTGDGAAALADHELPRVRAQAMRALAVTGDSEHLAVVRDRFDDEDAEVRKRAAGALDALERRLDL